MLPSCWNCAFVRTTEMMAAVSAGERWERSLWGGGRAWEIGGVEGRDEGSVGADWGAAGSLSWKRVWKKRIPCAGVQYFEGGV